MTPELLREDRDRCVRNINFWMAHRRAWHKNVSPKAARRIVRENVKRLRYVRGRLNAERIRRLEAVALQADALVYGQLTNAQLNKVRFALDALEAYDG